ncbi:hypothetical protein [Sphingomonas sp.]|uniref:hypothetical protein n=1 Tax=Sphingomonas sp. TaxID=28214 RepID=UPI001EB21D5C|nr:hypothetical protein [Sphingomonas sp.]MBX3595526.1 hypothetical protein [Sphingomonas sp.]
MRGRRHRAANDTTRAAGLLDAASRDDAFFRNRLRLDLRTFGAGLCDMHRAAADNGAAACASAKFCQCHPNRHVLLSRLAGRAPKLPMQQSLCVQCGKSAEENIKFNDINYYSNGHRSILMIMPALCMVNVSKRNEGGVNVES